MTVAVLLIALLRLAVALVVGGVLFALYRGIARRSRIIGAIAATTILLRAGAGLAMFWISYLHLPLARGLQIPGGFWAVALDATGYFQLGSHAVDTFTLYPLDHAQPAPLFLDVFSIWLGLLGVSPAAGMFLNVFVYIALIAAAVWWFRPADDWRQDLPAITCTIAYSFAPVILAHSTQPLKDEFFTGMAALACFGMLALSPLFYGARTASERRLGWWGAGAVTLATFATAGIRWYYAGLIWGAAAAVLALFALRGRTTGFVPYVAGAAALLTAVLIAFLAAAGPYGRVVTANFRRGTVFSVVSDAANITEVARSGFLMSGGGTNIVVPLRADAAAGKARHEALVDRQLHSAFYEQLQENRREAAERDVAVAPNVPGEPVAAAPGSVIEAQEQAARAIPTTRAEQAKMAAIGLAIVLVPTPLLHALTGVDIPHGRGFLAIADLDTVFLDVSVIATLVLLWRRRSAIGRRLPFVCYTLILSGTTAVLLGYVVTNFGTLWRMRPLVAVPLWLSMLALSPRSAPVSEFEAAPSPAAGDLVLR